LSNERPAAPASHGRAPAVAEVEPGVWAIPVPIPSKALRYMIAYAFDVGDGIVLIDAGWDAPDSLDELKAGLAVFDAAIEDVRGIVVTHIHPDHYGLAGHIRDLSGAWVAMHAAEAALIRDRYVDVDDLLEATRQWLVDMAAPADDVANLRDASMDLRRYVWVSRPDFLLEDGDTPDVPGWQLVAIHTPGHSPGHLCFHDAAAGLVVTGDHVLPRITPNVSFHPQSDPDPLSAFVSSLEKMRALTGVRVALPGHEWVFSDLSARVGEMLAHHAERLDIVRELVAAGAQTIWEIAERLPWSRPWTTFDNFLRRSALGEAYAHVVFLERRGELERVAESPHRWRGV
jgi:glyoxylase-like metal-dependent hydrolase (beta-lactamase superfamily II)